MLTIFRGNDLAFAECNRKVCVRFNTCLDLTGWSAKFYLVDNVKQTDDISSRIWTFGYTEEETSIFPLGKTFGKLVVFDSTGKVRQMAKVEVEIVNQIFEPVMEGLIAISVDNVLADYSILSNKPSLNGKVIEGAHDSDYYGIPSDEEINNISEKVDLLSEKVDSTSEKVDSLSGNVDLLTENVESQEERIVSADGKLETLEGNLESEARTRAQSDDDLGRAISNGLSEEADARNIAIEEAKNELGEEIETVRTEVEKEKTEREDSFASLTGGTMPISKLLFTADGDDENYYRIQVVMRDDGAGNMLPALALDAVPRHDDDSDSSDSSDSSESIA